MKWTCAIFAFFFLLMGFVPRADYEELAKLPSLIEHFEYHQAKEDKSISFFDFLSMHYNDASEDNDESHNELPFHNHEHCAGGVLMFSINYLNFSFIQPKVSFFFNAPKIKSLTSSYFANIWQPPCIL